MSDEWTTASGDSPVRPPSDDGMPGLAMAAGLVAALIGGGIWAAIALFANLEVGWVAWGIGAMVGGAMALTTRSRSRRLAIAAAVVALVGLTAGKAITFAGSAGQMADEMLADGAYMNGMTAWRMYEAGELEPSLQGAVEATEANGDTLSDAHWAAMLANAEARLAAMSAEERGVIARAAADEVVRQLGLFEGVRAQLGAFDLLWVALALATAFRIMDTSKVAPAPAPEPEKQRV